MFAYHRRKARPDGGAGDFLGSRSAALTAVFALVLAVVGVAPLSAFAQSCRPDSLEVRLTGGGVARFNIELADTPQTRSRGLMFREKMATAAGMLFIYERPQRAVFWMKNTLIPLDMIFADPTGLVTQVHANAIPHDETGIDGGEGVLAVLEINGGLAKRMGITQGAVLRHPAFAQNGAVWPCAK
ncbi:MAG: DUF192 domain-containing protein [Paracoccaceae bacterium]|nr:DUF192 domain-containing protein [Paracoccaceae bacterium]